MFRKIHSNRDPGDTVFSELKREFRPYINNAGLLFRSSVSQHPKTVFGLMIACILVSAVLAFTVFRQPQIIGSDKKPVKLIAPISTGMGQIIATGNALNEMMRLKKNIDSLSGKKQLNAQDSLALENALDRFQQLNKKFNQRK